MKEEVEKDKQRIIFENRMTQESEKDKKNNKNPVKYNK